MLGSARMNGDFGDRRVGRLCEGWKRYGGSDAAVGNHIHGLSRHNVREDVWFCNAIETSVTCETVSIIALLIIFHNAVAADGQ